MKRNKLYIIHAWLLLICFVAGQYMVYTHQHLFSKPITKSAYTTGNHHLPLQTVKETCNMCDVMHHQAAIINDSFQFSPQVAVLHFFKACQYNFVSIGLILAAGRAPPGLS